MKCPGQDSRYWDQKAIYEVKCPKCQAQVEFFKDESRRKCPSCGEQFLNPELNLGCAAYCKFAEQCLGELSPDIQAQRNQMLKDKIAVQVKHHLGRDFHGIARAMQVAEYAKKILFKEQADPAVVLIAAYLEEIARKQGIPQAQKILQDQGANQDLLQEVSQILEAIVSEEETSSTNLRVLQDALLLSHRHRQKDQGDLAHSSHSGLEEEFQTQAGKSLAKEVLLTQ